MPISLVPLLGEGEQTRSNDLHPGVGSLTVIRAGDEGKLCDVNPDGALCLEGSIQHIHIAVEPEVISVVSVQVVDEVDGRIRQHGLHDQAPGMYKAVTESSDLS